MQKAVRDALIAFMAATAEANAEAIKEAQRAGIDAAKGKQNRYLGRKPSYTRDQLTAVRDMLTQGAGITAISQATGLSRQTVYRIKNDPMDAEAVLANWDKRSVAVALPRPIFMLWDDNGRRNPVAIH